MTNRIQLDGQFYAVTEEGEHGWRVRRYKTPSDTGTQEKLDTVNSVGAGASRGSLRDERFESAPCRDSGLSTSMAARDPWFKPYANCDWCARTTHDPREFGKSCSNEGGFMREKCPGKFVLNPIFEKPAADPEYLEALVPKGAQDSLHRLVTWLEEESEEQMKSVMARKNMARDLQSGTAADLRAGQKIAEQMSGRKLPKMSMKQARTSAQMQERIAGKIEAEAIQLSKWADLLRSQLSTPEAAIRQAIARGEWK